MNQPDFAKHWALELGTNPDTLVQLQGGINNRVFRCGSQRRHWVIKGYPSNQIDRRDRMQAEVEFLRYAHLVAPRRVPRLISVDNERRCVVLQHIAGDAYREGVPPPKADVQSALEFFVVLNSHLDKARRIIQLDAAEGFLRLSQHMANVRERLVAMDTDHLPAKCKAQAAELLDQLNAQADRVEEKLEKQITSGLVDDALDPGLRCVSPSDFGFHNAIQTAEGVTFIDFEFAGWDDPAKAVIDFLLQPKMPVDNTLQHLLIYLNNQQLNIDKTRCNAFYPLLTLKWICIICSVLDRDRLIEILNVSKHLEPAQLIEERLAAARQYFDYV